MFTGLTNQVSTWMGKKAEDAGTELPPEEKIPVTAEGEELDRKDSPTKSGSKLDMLVGVKSQMTGWFSGGIPGLSRGGQGNEGESQGPKTMNGAQVAQTTTEGTVEQTKDDDASSATGGADSGPASLEGSPSEDKEGQQAFGGVSTKALAGAKTLGGFLYSAVNKAGKTVVEAGAKIKKTVEENRLVAELNREQEAFIANKHTEKGEAVAPWVGAPNEDILREECLSLSMDQRNFLKSPPKEVDFPWDFEAVQPMAQATLALDPNLENMRFQLVPKVISEENFWRNYFYRVSVLRQSHELNTMANQAENNLNQTSAGTVDQAEVQVTTGQESSGTVMTGSNSALADSPGHEFVSDSMRVSDTDLEEVREGMKKLGMQPPKAEEDWERELEAELKDYEVVTGNEERSSVETPVRSSGALDKDWEKQIDELLANEDDEDLK
ncbi:synapse-associated protein 1 isoform X3 [Apis laboriosa]|uniref:Synapse-associated protein of n=2 Tax=Apis cerana TaxID=7461 RepID=A0A2A3E8J4_APICC|nr:synapse-associated protein 1 isoform X3 [Apis dorsata]XP_016910524.1 synapse-associated protein 1 isoform X3 [Apis cerana]XP_043803355.1 synapse-associated protein 1 isoform X3 [Apis laboriosa]PBC28093.1 Synapse-associated protein of [Apis cerana cerana]